MDNAQGFSLREHLKSQGVRKEEDIRSHLSFIQKTLAVRPGLDLTRYRVSDGKDKSQPHMG